MAEESPEDTSHEAVMCEQIAINYLMKASRDFKHKEDWIENAVSYYDRFLLLEDTGAVDIRFFSAGHGFTSAGDLSSTNGCLYYGRAIKSFEQEEPLLQGDTATVHGKTFSLAPLRRENEKALGEVKEKFAKSGCKQMNARAMSRLVALPDMCLLGGITCTVTAFTGS